MKNELNFLSTRAGFNTALRHFKLVNKFIKQFESKKNLADVVNIALEEKQVTQQQFAVILNALLIDKYGYYSKSFNMKKTSSKSTEEIAEELVKWNAFDIVISYFHPQLGQMLINPKSKDGISTVDKFKENELVVVFVGNFKMPFDQKLAEQAVANIKKIFNEEKVTGLDKFYSAPEGQSTMVVQEAPAKKEEKKVITEKSQVNINANQAQKPQAASGVKKKLSPQYGILVANELFHNGNVEAWKRIIASYELKYTDTKVLVFYEGEEIKDINTLFKWGKVKHGTNIYVSLLGPEFRDVSKLRRYLSQGASNRFEDFLKGDPTKVLSLF